ncbi:MAG: tRNA uridine-5-carboxymethylaminomethyl(34) synthesis GTPase MnmE [Rhodomicrobium sp.]
MTIYALSTAHARAGIAIVRLSGKAAREALHRLCHGKVPAPRTAGLRALCDPQTGEVLDRGLVLWFPGPASFTGEDMGELHLHGGRAVIAGVLDALRRLGLRMAEPGEFTKRAFENGKLDLTEAEGLADLISAETAAQRQQAVAQSDGALRERYEAWRASLLRAMAYVEASLDFPDEGDIAENAFNAALPKVRALIAALDHALADGRRGEIVREGIQVAIVGAPNVGKSSLLNALLGREAAIVFDEPGTTRDIIEVTLDLDGFPFVLRDTAGLREAASAVEREGIRRALAAAEGADVVLAMIDASAPHPAPLPLGEGTMLHALRRVQASLLPGGEGQDEGSEPRVKAVIAVLNKIDFAPSTPAETMTGAIAISAKTGEGLDALKAALAAFARDNFGAGEAPLITRARHCQEIERARTALASFLTCADAGERTELAAEHLREAADALGRLTGRLDVEDVLGQIFSEFCVGK